MAMTLAEANSLTFGAEGQHKARDAKQSLLVACLLTMSGGFLDAYAWLSFGGVFANSQTGNVVFLGMYVALGKWGEAFHHVPPILSFLAGAGVASRVRAPLLCLWGEILSLAVVMLWLRSHPELAIIGISFGVALQATSFRQVDRWKYLSVTVTGNLLRAVDQIALPANSESVRGARTLLIICGMFLLGAATGGPMATHWPGVALLVPIGLSMCALWFCYRSGRRTT
ncbi:uncharacterized membrane protein YoaK (UPF0700 family) [Bradyrhizobium elkanii]|nr:uncharacterized membrane protein YoaK (UPF0700 family) [Bradyrhizobium elkanii]MCW2171680.1 uncharacterized membrane protein YoaK (UPF0700 family) [Bradyrhizobium elkanii]